MIGNVLGRRLETRDVFSAVYGRDVNVTSKKVTVTVTRYFGKKSNRYSYSLHFQNE